MRELTERLARKVWETFNKDDIQNNDESNWRCAEDIIRRLLNGTHKLEEFRNFFNSEDYEYIKRQIDDSTRSKED